MGLIGAGVTHPNIEGDIKLLRMCLRLELCSHKYSINTTLSDFSLFIYIQIYGFHSIRPLFTVGSMLL